MLKTPLTQAQFARFNLLTGLLLIVIGSIDLARGDYAFGASWIVFGCMYLSFESGIGERIRQCGLWLGLLAALFTLIYSLMKSP